MPRIGLDIYAMDYWLYITDSGCYDCGWNFTLPSHGRCFFELAVWYRGQH